MSAAVTIDIDDPTYLTTQQILLKMALDLGGEGIDEGHHSVRFELGCETYCITADGDAIRVIQVEGPKVGESATVARLSELRGTP